jgi:hypothetical protein
MEAKSMLRKLKNIAESTKIVKVLLSRIKNIEEDASQAIATERPATVTTPSTQASTAPTMRIPEEERARKKEQKRQQYAKKQAQTLPSEKDPDSDEVQEASQESQFSQRQLDALEEFANARGAVKPEELNRILNILGASQTKSGYIIDGSVGGHRPHGKGGTVDPGAITGVKNYIKQKVNA